MTTTATTTIANTTASSVAKDTDVGCNCVGEATMVDVEGVEDEGGSVAVGVGEDVVEVVIGNDWIRKE